MIHTQVRHLEKGVEKESAVAASRPPRPQEEKNPLQHSKELLYQHTLQKAKELRKKFGGKFTSPSKRHHLAPKKQVTRPSRGRSQQVDRTGRRTPDVGLSGGGPIMVEFTTSASSWAPNPAPSRGHRKQAVESTRKYPGDQGRALW